MPLDASAEESRVNSTNGTGELDARAKASSSAGVRFDGRTGSGIFPQRLALLCAQPLVIAARSTDTAERAKVRRMGLCMSF